MTYMELITEYARLCNVDAQDMLNHIQNDRFAEIQFLDWCKRELAIELQLHHREA